jgi:hypothetical protein
MQRHGAGGARDRDRSSPLLDGEVAQPLDQIVPVLVAEPRGLDLRQELDRDPSGAGVQVAEREHGPPPSIHMGTIGACAAIARMAGPFLNALVSPSFERRPSMDTQTRPPPPRYFTAPSSSRRAWVGHCRMIGIPNPAAIRPNPGNNRNSTLALSTQTSMPKQSRNQLAQRRRATKPAS